MSQCGWRGLLVDLWRGAYRWLMGKLVYSLQRARADCRTERTCEPSPVHHPTRGELALPNVVLWLPTLGCQPAHLDLAGWQLDGRGCKALLHDSAGLYLNTVFFPTEAHNHLLFGQVNEKQMRGSCMIRVRLYYSRQQTEATLNWWIVKGVQLWP